MSTLMIPFNNQPVDTVQLTCSPNSTASYTVPAGKYARVSYFTKYGSYVTVNGTTIAESFSTSDYAHPTAGDAIQKGWESFEHNWDCGAGANSANSASYTFDSGWTYSNIRLCIELNNTHTAQYLRASYGGDSNNFLPIYKEKSNYTNASSKEYIVNNNIVLNNVTGSLEMRIITHVSYAQTATMRIFGSRKRKHDGESFNNNGFIWVKSGDVIGLGETHFSNSQAMCHIELYNEQS